MRLHFFAFIAATALLTITSNAIAIQLGYATRTSWSGHWSTEPVKEVSFEPTYYDEFFLPEISLSLGRSFSEADVGGTWSFVNFGDYAAKLTNGTNDFTGLLLSFGSSGAGSFAPESLYWDFSGDISGPDFNGYKITGIDFTLNALSILRPGWDPNGDGNWNEAHFTTTLTIHGEAVPEGDPFALPLLGSCLIGFVLFRSCVGLVRSPSCRD